MLPIHLKEFVRLFVDIRKLRMYSKSLKAGASNGLITWCKNTYYYCCHYFHAFFLRLFVEYKIFGSG